MPQPRGSHRKDAGVCEWTVPKLGRECPKLTPAREVSRPVSRPCRAVDVAMLRSSCAAPSFGVQSSISFQVVVTRIRAPRRTGLIHRVGSDGAQHIHEIMQGKHVISIRQPGPPRGHRQPKALTTPRPADH
jgi:hypothetical protein